jgi:regulator of protease activity HflC (stomatin/prohibitin superfamily)
MMMGSIVVIVGALFACFLFEGVLLGILRLFGFYTIVDEREARVYVLFGNVLGVISEPGLHFLWGRFGWQAFFVNWLGQCHVRSLALDQEYLRSTPVNSEEGAPMGIGVWYEMFISDPVAHVFRNADPRGSLRANVGNSTVKCLSNMRLTQMLEDRHAMSKTVREEVSAQSTEWGYQAGSVYVRKVHFRDLGMIRQIEEKVVNRLRQVTAAIRQAGANQVNLIASTAEKEAAVAFAKAAAMRPQIVGACLKTISEDQPVSEALFEVLETQQMIEGDADITLLPPGESSGLLSPLLAAGDISPKRPGSSKNPPESR